MARITKIELQQINARLAAENAALRAELSSLHGDIANGVLVPATQRTQRRVQDTSVRRTKLEALKHLATKFRCAARLRDGAIELYSRKRQCWVAVPEGEQA